MTRKPEGTTDAPVRKDRRDFLKFAGSAAPLAAVAVATTGSEAEAAKAPDLSSYPRHRTHARLLRRRAVLTR